VTATRYLGPVNRVSVRVGDTTITADLPASGDAPSAGTAVALTWAEDALHRMEEA